MKTNKLNQFFKIFLAVILTAFSFSSCQVDNSEVLQDTVDAKSEIPLISKRVGDFLYEQEDLGGHTIERHVGKSKSYLQNRLDTSSISAASTYYDLSSAEDAIINGILDNESSVINWLGKSSSRYTINYTSDYNVGVVLKRGSRNTVNSSRIVVVLQRKSSTINGFYVLTSYPN